jgi:hypothetical protein
MVAFSGARTGGDGTPFRAFHAGPACPRWARASSRSTFTVNIDAKFIEMPRRTKTQFCAAEEALLFSIERFDFPIRES